MSKNINLKLTIPKGLEQKYLTFLNDEYYTEMAWLGGFGCVDGGTPVYCAERMIERPIREWHERREAPVVFAYADGDVALAQAEVPFLKGQAELFEVEFTNGAVLTMKGDHHVLGGQDWVLVGALDSPGVRLPALPPNDLASAWAWHPRGDRQWILRGLGGSPMSGYRLQREWQDAKVVSVTPVGERDYYDLTVPTHGNYITGGIVHHNTAKSDCLVTSIIKTAYDYPGCTMVLARDELVNLKRTTLADLLLKAPELIAHHNKTESIITFPEIPDHNGIPRASTLVCFGLLTGDYVQKLKSLQPFRIFIDEADKILEEMLDMCVLRLRQKAYHRETGKLGKNQVKVVANDEGNNWLWRRFVGRPHPGKAMNPAWVRENVGIREEFFVPLNPMQDLYEGDIVQYRGERRIVQQVTKQGAVLEGLDRVIATEQLKVVIQRFCVYAFSHENKSLNQQNLKNARGVSAAMRAKYILSQVDTQTGLIFPEFDVQTHVIPDQHVPYSWKTIVGLDHGFEHPTAAIAMALDTSGDVIIFKEYKAHGLSVPDNAENLAELMDGYEDVRFFADSQLWSVDPRRPGETMANDYIRAGVTPLIRANKNRELSISRLKEYLTVKPASIYHPEEKPRMFVMESCKDTIRTLMMITWEQYKKKEDDDILDALRYAIMAIYNAARTAPIMGDELLSGPRPFEFRQY